MPETIDVLRFINLFAQAFMAGSMNWVWMVTLPALKRMTERESVRTHQTQFDDLPDRFLPLLGITSVVSTTAILILADLTPRATLFYSIGLVAMIVVGLLTFFLNVPTNRMIRHWSPDAIPQNYPAIRRRWNLVHGTRVVLAGIAMACFIIATLDS